MALENEKLINSITKLIKLTQEDKIEWFVAPQSEKNMIKNNENLDGSIFKAIYKEKILRLYKSRIKVEKNDPYAVFVYPEQKKYGWTVRYRLEIVDDNGNYVWVFPEANSLSDLFQAVQYQVSGISTLIDELLSE